MRNILTTISFSLLASTALADDFTAQLTAERVTVYPEGASLFYTAQLDLTPGQHRILLPYRGTNYGPQAPNIKVSQGVTIAGVSYLSDATYDQDTLLTTSQRAAKTALEAAKEALKAQDRTLRDLKLQIAALDSQQGFLQSISGAKLADAAPEQLLALSDMILTQSQGAVPKRLDLETALGKAKKARKKLAEAEKRAQRAFDRLAPPSGQGGMMAISVQVDAPVSARFQVNDITMRAGWHTDYDFRLTTGDAPSLNVKRKVIVTQNTGQSWVDVDVTLATISPFAQSSPSDPGRNLASIAEQMGVKNLSRKMRVTAAPGIAEAREAKGMEQDRAFTGQAAFNGLSLTYTYPHRVTLESADATQLALGQFDLPVETSLLAVPRRDKFAFVMAAVTNDTKEPLLPGSAAFYRDGDFIGYSGIEMLPPGAKQDLAFGALHSIRLKYTALRQETGDTGIITTSNTREDLIEFSVENLTSKPQKVRTLFALPFSQQQDLTISTRIRPNPTETDLDDKRGVAAWDMLIPSGETQKVRINSTLEWPKGQELYWYP